MSGVWILRPSYNSCRNRHCPKCQTLSKERWIDAQKGNLLNVGYFHVIFTVPQELNPWIYRNQQDCYNLLFCCVAETIQELSADKKEPPLATPLTASASARLSAAIRECVLQAKCHR